MGRHGSLRYHVRSLVARSWRAETAQKRSCRVATVCPRARAKRSRGNRESPVKSVDSPFACQAAGLRKISNFSTTGTSSNTASKAQTKNTGP